MADCSQFEALAQALITLTASSAAAAAKAAVPAACFEGLLSEAAVKRLLREDADAGCGVLIAVLVALDRAGVVLEKKVQDAVSKV